MRYLKTLGIRIAPSTRVKEVVIDPSDPHKVVAELRRACSVLQRAGIKARPRRSAASEEIVIVIENEYVARAIILLLAEGISASVRK